MIPARKDIVIIQGASFLRTFTFKDADDNPVDLTGYNARLPGRYTVDDEDTLFSWSSEGDSPVLTMGGAAGTVAFSIPPSVTKDYAFDIGYQDLEFYTSSDAIVLRIWGGNVVNSKEVTR